MMGMHCCNCYWKLLDLLPSHARLWEPCAATSDAQGVATQDPLPLPISFPGRAQPVTEWTRGARRWVLKVVLRGPEYLLVRPTPQIRSETAAWFIKRAAHVQRPATFDDFSRWWETVRETPADAVRQAVTENLQDIVKQAVCCIDGSCEEDIIHTNQVRSGKACVPHPHGRAV